MKTEDILQGIGMTEGAKDARLRILDVITSYKKAGYSKKETIYALFGIFEAAHIDWMWAFTYYMLKKHWRKL